MLTELAANRVNMITAANPGCQWLFPGQRAGQPLMPIGLRRQLHELGIPLTQARTAAFRQLVLQTPPPVVARSLGFDLTAVLRAVADGLPAGEAAQLTITRSDRVRWAAAVQYATAWAASSTGLL
jgi:hypothetical protein